MTTAKSYKPKRHIVIDVETLSTKRNAAVVDLAAVVVDFNRSTTDTFQVYIRQAEQHGITSTDPGTVDWHHKQDPEFLQVCEANGITFVQALAEFIGWLQIQGDGVELHFWSQGKDFDFPILENLFHIAGYNIPWAYSRVHCLRDLVWLNPAARIRSNEPTAHKALPDAIFEAQQLAAVVNNSSWYQRLFK